MSSFDGGDSMVAENSQRGWLRKAGPRDASGMSISDRNALIRKLKTIKDPRERDRVLYLLAGQERREDSLPAARPSDFFTALPPGTEAKRLPPRLPSGSQEDREPVPETETPLPPVRGLGLLIGSIVPVFFLIMGIIFVLSSLAEYQKGENPNNLFTGIIFIIFGAIGLFKAKKAAKNKT